MSRIRWAVKAGVVAGLMFLVLGLSGVIDALINPSFTPIDLVEQSDLVMLVKFKGAVEQGKATATVARVLKGKPDKQTIVIDFSNSPYQEHAKFVQDMIKAWGDEPVLLFVGEIEDTSEGGYIEDWGYEGGGEEETKGLMHIAGQWIRLYATETGGWEMDKIDEQLLATWNGGTDMLLRCVEYILSDRYADIPVTTEAEWGEQVEVGKVEGKVYVVQSVDLKGDGQAYLYIASDKGDHLFLFDKEAKAFKDVTGDLNLTSRSSAAVWADFNADGRLDLLSWDGKSLNKHLQAEDGTFSSVALGIGGALTDGCIGLAVVDSGNQGVPAIVASTKAYPVLLLPGDEDTTSAHKLVTGALPGKDLGEPGACLVADFDDDNLPDIIQPFARGGLFYKGKAPAVFAEPKRLNVGLGPGRAAACLGDYDGDGMLDILCAAEDFPRLWHNYGNLNFAETFGLTGESSYIAKPEGVGVVTGDVNNDGRQDVLILYSAMSPQIFFNRGFRSFGHSHMLDLAEHEMLPQAESGQQVGCLADLNADGAQDMALVLDNGEVWVFFRDTYGEALCLKVALPLTGVNAGPVKVTGSLEKRGLGAWNVVAGTQEAFFGLIEPGPVTLKWQLPGGKLQEKEIIVEDNPVRFVITE